MSDDLGLGDLGAIPMPPPKVESTDVTDAFTYPVACNFAFVGVGQAGGRIAAAFHAIGYRRVCAVNTTTEDLSLLKLPEETKLNIGESMGAGKDPRLAAAVFENKDEKFFDLFKKCWGSKVDYPMVCFAAAGGTGAGGHSKIMQVARKYMDDTSREIRCGAIVALPKTSEGARLAKNALETIKSLVDSGISPLILIDNEKLNTLYQPTAAAEHDTYNQSVARLLHLFNRSGATESEHTTFDRSELRNLLDSGIVSFGAQTLDKWETETDISTPIREELENSVLASVDLRTGNIAGLIFVLNGKTYEEVKVKNLDHAAQMLTRILDGDSTVFTGIYRGASNVDNITVLAMLGRLGWPNARLRELAKVAGGTHKDIAGFLGVDDLQ